MKVCESCEAEIDTKDGENLCASCEKSAAWRKRQREAARARRAAMDSIGMVRVRGSMGGTYWE